MEDASILSKEIRLISSVHLHKMVSLQAKEATLRINRPLHSLDTTVCVAVSMTQLMHEWDTSDCERLEA